MEERVITFGAIGSFLVIVAIIVQFIVLYLFIRATIDLHFLRKEFEKLKRIHRLGEYHLVKGERIYEPGEKLYCEELKAVVTIIGLKDNGLYYCEARSDKGVYYVKNYYIAGDKLSELPKEGA